MYKYILGFLLCFIYMAGMASAWKQGQRDGINEIVNSCSYYSKYAIDGTQVLLCSAIISPQDLLDQTMQHIYHPYDKEDVIKNRKNRK